MKVGYKARRGRKRSPVPHQSHRFKGGIADPITRSFVADQRLRRARALGRR